jgi:hypothetical protein
MANKEEEKQKREREVFLGFIDAAHLPIDPQSVKSRKPDYPDIECVTRGSATGFFELGEVQWHDDDAPIKSSAHAEAVSGERANEKEALLAAGRDAEAEAIQTWVGVRIPVLGSLLRMFNQKCEKLYETDGHPVSLLLYYSRESPDQPFEDLFGIRDALRYMISRSPFSDVWLYHHALGYGHRFPETIASEGLVFRAPLASFVTPEDQRQVIGRVAIKDGEMTMVFDASYSADFGRGIRIRGFVGFEKD